MHPMLNIAIQAARNASKIIMRSIDHLESVETNEKSQNEFANEVARLSAQEITQVIRKAYPDHGILIKDSEPKDDDYCWIIDPLDGKGNFSHGFPHYAISIAVKHKSDIEVSVIYDPVRQELFMATRGEGAQLNNRRIRISNCKRLENALLGTGFPFRQEHHLKHYLDIFQTIFPQSSGVRRAGSAALDLAYVAAGRLDGFWEMTLRPWDMTAGVSDFLGEANYLDSGNLIAGTPKILKAILKVVEPVLQE